ncbi:MAG: helix-turn-helix domain-containing protein [Eubacteriales bacterium]
MSDIKSIIAKNITLLRTQSGMTQLDLAEKLHYSDKAVSKWERGESVPEIGTLTAIADLFGVTLDYLVRADHDTVRVNPAPVVVDDRKRKNHALIAGMSVLLVWFVAILAFVFTEILISGAKRHWLALIFAVPVSMIVWLVFNSIWFNRRRNYLIISLLMWTLLAAVHITVLTFGYNIWPIYAPGIPGQIIIIMWSKLKFRKT